MAAETEREARMRRYQHATAGFEESMRREAEERRAAGIRAHAIWQNICAEHGLNPGPAPRPRSSSSSTGGRASTSTTRADTGHKLTSAPWAVREMHPDGRFTWHKVAGGGTESAARALANELDKPGAGKIEALQLGGRRQGRGEVR